jgi:hypothetical protein
MFGEIKGNGLTAIELKGTSKEQIRGKPAPWRTCWRQGKLNAALQALNIVILAS